MNTTQFYEGVSEDAWNFTVGGYQVCHKWLKDRTGSKLTYDELALFRRILAAISLTLPKIRFTRLHHFLLGRRDIRHTATAMIMPVIARVRPSGISVVLVTVVEL